MDINYFDFYSFLQIDEITTKIILEADIDILQNLYLISNKLFANHLETHFILKKLQIKFDLEKYSINNFNDLIMSYKSNLLIPPKFDQFTDNGDELQLKWNQKDVWLNKFRDVRKSNLMRSLMTGLIWKCTQPFPFFNFYGHDDSIICDSKIILEIEYDQRTPSEQLYNNINKLYLQISK